jgi:hypothetical protein
MYGIQVTPLLQALQPGNGEALNLSDESIPDAIERLSRSL